uniref:(northern house mosquito) hypothetical protein n=1 Tax=Culex pipiens TaxID=7175 RepID=A0A8D8NF87_CULPI
MTIQTRKNDQVHGRNRSTGKKRIWETFVEYCQLQAILTGTPNSFWRKIRPRFTTKRPLAKRGKSVPNSKGSSWRNVTNTIKQCCTRPIPRDSWVVPGRHSVPARTEP